MMKKLLAALLALSLLTAPVLAADAPAAEPMPAWGLEILADGYALGLFGDEIAAGHSQTVTEEQVDAMVQVVSEKLALLEMPAAEAPSLPTDTTRGGVVNALYQAAAAYRFPGIDQPAADYLASLGVLRGDGTGLHLDRPCTALEAAAMAERLILALYDQQNAGSLGLLWQAQDDDGTTLYLLGSIHTDRNHVYPFHRQLRDIIHSADQVTFELNFNDTEQVQEFAAMQTYTDGTTLADHVSPALYDLAVEAGARLGMDEATTAQYKAWVLGSTFQSTSMTDSTTSSNAMALDLYVNAAAYNDGTPIDGVETYAFQGGIYDSLSPEYQEVYLATGLLMFLGVDGLDQSGRDALTDVLGAEALEPASQEALDQEVAQVGLWMGQWKARDVEGFTQAYPKDEIIHSDDELNSRLFTDRDPGMIRYAADYLEENGATTGLLVVGAGHMVGETGIVQGLIDLGYDVQVVPNP